MAGGFFRIKSVLGRPGKDGLDREAMPTLLVTTKRRSQEWKEGLEPSTSALERLCSTIKLFPPATTGPLDRLLKDLLIPHVLSEPPIIQSLACDCLQPFPEKGRDEGIVCSRSCDESNIVRSRILRTTGPRPRSPLRRTIY
ncbi:unnamed protein product [Vicia faba]|uniref:Uncharacterized protein n=1 Tax=Vicia faba TaxID=3906 RepID=A0AAV1AAU6_VICFA|nr:unnamed protein product [Vicia faba]